MRSGSPKDTRRSGRFRAAEPGDRVLGLRSATISATPGGTGGSARRGGGARGRAALARRACRVRHSGRHAGGSGELPFPRGGSPAAAAPAGHLQAPAARCGAVDRDHLDPAGAPAALRRRGGPRRADPLRVPGRGPGALGQRRAAPGGTARPAAGVVRCRGARGVPRAVPRLRGRGRAGAPAGGAGRRRGAAVARAGGGRAGPAALRGAAEQAAVAPAGVSAPE